MNLNRDAIRAKLGGGPVAVIIEARRLGYKRGRFSNGIEVIASADGSDWIHPPTHSMREFKAFSKAWNALPLLVMRQA